MTRSIFPWTDTGEAPRRGPFREEKLEKLIRSSSNGRVVSEGVKTVILGKPNAGKIVADERFSR